MNAPAETAQTAGARRIDVHRHAVAKNLLAEAKKIPGWQGTTEGNAAPYYAKWSPDWVVEDMDKHDIATSIMSTSPSFAYPGMWLAKLEARRNLSRIQNEFLADMARDKPSRFGLFASLPLPDIEGSLREIEYAFDTLKADGIMMVTSHDGRYPSDPGYIPVMEELNRRKAVVFVHPQVPTGCSELVPHLNRIIIEGPVDTTRAIANLVFTGALARFTDIQYIFCHGGGVTPILIQRLERAGNYNPAVSEMYPGGFQAEMRKLWFDVIAMTNVIAGPCLLNFVAPDRLLFGTDHPAVPSAVTVGGLPSLNLPAGDLRAVERENATILFPRLAA